MGRRTKASIPIEVTVGAIDAEGEESPNGVNGAGGVSSLATSPLFADLDHDQDVDHIVIARTKPVAEGQLGEMPPDADENYIRDQWGGGTFRVQGRTARRVPVKGAFRTINIAGEPIFESVTARKQWEYMKRQRFAADDTVAQPAAAPAGRSAEDQIALEESRHRRELERIRVESEAAVARANAEAAASVARAKAEAAERENGEERRRTREREEENTRRDRDREEEESRRQRDRDWFEQQRDRDREWQKLTQGQKAQQQQDPIEVFAKMGKIFAEARGAGGDGEYPDAVTAAMARLPETIGALKDVAVDAIAEGTSKRDGRRRRRDTKPERNHSAEEKITLDGALAAKAKRAAAHLHKQGKGKEAERILASAMARVFDNIAQTRVVEGGKGKGASKSRKPAKPTPKPLAKPPVKTARTPAA